MRELSARRLSFAAWVLAGLGLSALAFRAARACPPNDLREVKVSVVTILATEQNKKVDPRLECVAREVRNLHPHLTGFRFLKMACKSVPLRGTETFDLVVDQKASVTVLRDPDRQNRVRLKINPPTMGEVTYVTPCGKFFPIVTRYQTKDQEWLLLAVRVQPCPGDKKK
jgi:hypothetical protein